MSRPVVAVVNLGTALAPSHRLTVDGVVVARGTKDGLEPLRAELAADQTKAFAIRDHVRLHSPETPAWTGADALTPEADEAPPPSGEVYSWIDPQHHLLCAAITGNGSFSGAERLYSDCAAREIIRLAHLPSTPAPDLAKIDALAAMAAALPYLDSPEVQALPFAQHAAVPAQRLRASALALEASLTPAETAAYRTGGGLCLPEGDEDAVRLSVGDLLSVTEEAADDAGFGDLAACLNTLWLLWSLGREDDARGALAAVSDSIRAALRACKDPEASE